MSDDGWGGFTPEPGVPSQPEPDATVPISASDPTVPLAAPRPAPSAPNAPTASGPTTPASAPSPAPKSGRGRAGVTLGVVVAIAVGIGTAVAVGRGSSSDTTVAPPITTVAVTVPVSVVDSTIPDGTIPDTLDGSVPSDSVANDLVPNDSPYAAEVRAELTPYQATEYEIGCVTGVADRAGTDSANDPAVAAQVVGCLSTRTLGLLLAQELQKTTGGTIDGVCVGEDLDDLTPEQRSALLAATSSGVDDGTAQQMLLSLVDDCKNT